MYSFADFEDLSEEKMKNINGGSRLSYDIGHTVGRFLRDRRSMRVSRNYIRNRYVRVSWNN